MLVRARLDLLEVLDGGRKDSGYAKCDDECDDALTTSHTTQYARKDPQQNHNNGHKLATERHTTNDGYQAIHQGAHFLYTSCICTCTFDELITVDIWEEYSVAFYDHTGTRTCSNVCYFFILYYTPSMHGTRRKICNTKYDSE